MTRAQRLERVVGIDVETCSACGGAVQIIACIKDPGVIEKIVTHVYAKGPESEVTWRPPSRSHAGGIRLPLRPVRAVGRAQALLRSGTAIAGRTRTGGGAQPSDGRYTGTGIDEH